MIPQWLNEHGALIIDDYNDSLISISKFFTGYLVSTSLADAASLETLVRTNSGQRIDITYLLKCGGDAYFSLCEAPVVTGSGAEIVPVCRNRYNNNEALFLTFYGTPTLSGTGTCLREGIIPGGTRVMSPGSSHGGRRAHRRHPRRALRSGPSVLRPTVLARPKSTSPTVRDTAPQRAVHVEELGCGTHAPIHIGPVLPTRRFYLPAAARRIYCLRWMTHPAPATWNTTHAAQRPIINRQPLMQHRETRGASAV